MKNEDFITKDFIDKIESNLSIDLYDTTYIKFDRLCKKIDVVKEVYSSYKKNLSKSTSKNHISTNTYVSLLNILLFFAKEKNDLKYFNSALKLFDKINTHIDTALSNNIKVKIDNIFKAIK